MYYYQQKSLISFMKTKIVRFQQKINYRNSENNLQ